MAYVNFPSPLTPSNASQPSLASPTKLTIQRKAWAKIVEGYGSRHLHETAPFSQWDQDKEEFCVAILPFGTTWNLAQESISSIPSRAYKTSLIT